LLALVSTCHDVIDVRLQREADLLAGGRFELEDVQLASDPHFEEYGI
jgi:hypothetical protein